MRILRIQQHIRLYLLLRNSRMKNKPRLITRTLNWCFVQWKYKLNVRKDTLLAMHYRYLRIRRICFRYWRKEAWRRDVLLNISINFKKKRLMKMLSGCFGWMYFKYYTVNTLKFIEQRKAYRIKRHFFSRWALMRLNRLDPDCRLFKHRNLKEEDC